MMQFRYMYGTVYIFENKKAQRVKVGMTTNDVTERLRNINDMWLERKATCQVCGGRRLVDKKGVIPKHMTNGKYCLGSEVLPLEKDISLANKYLNELRAKQLHLKGSEKGSLTRIIKNLEKRIYLYENHAPPLGIWRLGTVYWTEKAEEVELMSHKLLNQYLDNQALFGEVFCCTVEQAEDAVESVLKELDLLDSAKKESRDDVAPYRIW